MTTRWQLEPEKSFADFFFPSSACGKLSHLPTQSTFGNMHLHRVGFEHIACALRAPEYLITPFISLLL